jgi:hypothetical protein
MPITTYQTKRCHIPEIYNLNYVSHSMSTGKFFPEENGWGMKLTTHLQLGPSLKTSESITDILVYAFMVYTETTFYLPFLLFI